MWGFFPNDVIEHHNHAKLHKNKPLRNMVVWNSINFEPFPQMCNHVAILGKQHFNLVGILHG
jgi:hypothetical protein